MNTQKKRLPEISTAYHINTYYDVGFWVEQKKKTFRQLD